MQTVDLVIPTLLTNPQLLAQTLDSVSALIVDDLSVTLLLVANTDLEQAEQFWAAYPGYAGNLTDAPKQLTNGIRLSWQWLSENKGFTGAVNVGVASGKAPLIALLNDDTHVDKRWLVELVSKHEKTGAPMVASKIFRFSDPAQPTNTDQVDSMGFTFLWRGKALALVSPEQYTEIAKKQDYWLRHPQFLSNSNSEMNSSEATSFFQEPFGPDAAAALYTRQLWQQLGGLQSSFFAYLEDVDFALRARQTGAWCVLAEKAIVYHYKHATSGRRKAFKAQQDFKNWWKIVASSYPRQAWRRFLTLILLERLKNLKGLLQAKLT